MKKKLTIGPKQRLSLDSLVSKILWKWDKEIMNQFLHNKSKNNKTISKFFIKSRLSGHNYEILFIDLYTENNKKPIGNICLKYSLDKDKKDPLRREFVILNLFKNKKIPCPKIIGASFSKNEQLAYILMETIKSKHSGHLKINLKTARLILNAIKLHELVLSKNSSKLKLTKKNNLHKNIDFEKKILYFLKNFAPDFVIRTKINFLNNYLNNTFALKHRVYTTDRSIDNIYVNKKIIFIDFSTVRIGSIFDNWIQFINDPRATFLCSKEDLIKLFLKTNKMSKEHSDLFYAASIYTNLLQAIFTYSKNRILGRSYIKNTNDAFNKLITNKGVLIDID
jgi:hypothetical protein